VDKSAIPASVGTYPLPRGEIAADMTPSSIYSPKIRWLALVGIFFVSLNLRAAVTSLSAIYRYMSPDLPGLDISLLGTLPLLAFALFGSLSSRLVHRLGFEKSLVMSMFLVVIGIGLRAVSHSFWIFVVCTIVALAGMGFGNVLMPPVIKKYFPDHIGVMTALYSVMIAISAGLPSAIAVPITEMAGWRSNVGLWAVTAALAMIPWLFMSALMGGSLAHLPHPSVESLGLPPPTAKKPHIPVYKWPVAWSMVMLFGISMMSMYSMLTWLPVYLVSRGITNAAAGNMLFVYNIVGIVHSILVPIYLGRMKHPYLIVLLGGVLQIAGYLGFLLMPSGAWLWAVVAAPGLMTIPATFDLINLRTRTSIGAASLSSFTQGAGYVLAAAGPFLTGKLQASTGGWPLAFGFLSVMAVVMLIAGGAAVQRRYLEDA